MTCDTWLILCRLGEKLFQRHKDWTGSARREVFGSFAFFARRKINNTRRIVPKVTTFTWLLLDAPPLSTLDKRGGPGTFGGAYRSAWTNNLYDFITPQALRCKSRLLSSDSFYFIELLWVKREANVSSFGTPSKAPQSGAFNHFKLPKNDSRRATEVRSLSIKKAKIKR